MKKLVVYAMVAAALTIFNGCQKNELVRQLADEQPQAVVKPNVYVENGFLVFRDHKSVSETLRNNEMMTEKERILWERNHNFYSQLSMFNEIVNAELLLVLPYENMSEEELKQVVPPPIHSDTYYSFLKKEIIKEYAESDGSTSYEYSTSAPYLASILDENGIFMVADTMYQFIEGAIKIWEDADINDLSAMVINKNEDIQVHIIQKGDELLKGAISPNPKYSDWAYSGSSRRIKIGLYFDIWPSNINHTIWSYQHYTHARSEKKNIFGNWNLNWTDMYILGRWDGELEYELLGSSNTAFYNFSAYFHDYPTPYHIYANDFYSSMSIESGSIYPHPATMSISYSEIYPQNNEILDVSLTDFYWQVSGHNDAIATLND